MLSGVIIAARIYNSEHTSESLIQPRDYGYAVLLWVYLNVRWQLELITVYHRSHSWRTDLICSMYCSMLCPDTAAT